MSTSSIEWTDATWNPVTGCTRVSTGCDFCYAATLTKRLAAMGQAKYEGLVNPGKGHFNGVIKTHPDFLDVPLRTKKPTMFFVNSMSDLFHKAVPAEFIVDVFDVMARTPHHTYQVLTKRPERMREIMPWVWSEVARRVPGGDGCLSIPLPNVWLGTSVEDADVAARVDELREVPAAIRFLSCEPLLGPLSKLNLSGIHWVIAGGESGQGARPLNASWIGDIIAQCHEAKVACFVKQLGARPYILDGCEGHIKLSLSDRKGGDPAEWPPALRVREYPAVPVVEGPVS